MSVLSLKKRLMDLNLRISLYLIFIVILHLSVMSCLHMRFFSFRMKKGNMLNTFFMKQNQNEKHLNDEIKTLIMEKIKILIFLTNM